MISDSGSCQPSSAPACLFCRIVDGQIPAELEHEDDDCIAFRDIHPQAPLHLLIIPRAHIDGLAQCGAVHALLLGRLLLVAAQLAERADKNASGYRVVINNGRDGGQTVDHLHIHLLAGRALGWPPG